MNPQLVSRLTQQLESLAGRVGFEFKGVAEPVDEMHAPEDTRVWANSFALLALVTLSTSDKLALTTMTQTAQDWIFRRLTTEEKRGKFIDGYLLIALPEAPSSTLDDVIQNIRLNCAVCRKQVIWPSEDGDWLEQLEGVTALGLPAVGGYAAGRPTTPTLTATAIKALDLYRIHANYESVAKELREQARIAAKKE